MGWKYIKGSEKDFKGAPENAIERIESDKGSKDHLVGWLVGDMLVGINGYKEKFQGLYGYRNFVTAQREYVDEVVSEPLKKYNPIFLPYEEND